MTRYAAFLRGVSPMNCRMPALRQCFEAAGFTEVKTLLSSGNVLFDAKPEIVPQLEERAELAMKQHLGRVFQTIVRPASHLQRLVASDPYAGCELPAHAKPVVTFLRRPFDGALALPIEHKGARILKLGDAEVFSAYVPGDDGPEFMVLLERTFGKDITTRTLGTVTRCAHA